MKESVKTCPGFPYPSLLLLPMLLAHLEFILASFGRFKKAINYEIPSS